MAYNNPVQRKESACKQLTSETGKPSGLMMEGSVAYQESEKQEKENLEGPKAENPIVDKGTALEMSPYKMDSALHNNDPYSRAAANDKVFADAKKSKYSRSNPKHAGSNFFPPANPKAKKDLVKGKTADEDLASYFYDSNQDGDSVFRDYNQDGTMVGRFITNLFK